jgi:uncharacterized protein YacL
MAFLVMMMTVTILYVINTREVSRFADTPAGISVIPGWHVPLTAGILLCLLVLAIDLLTPRKKIATISSVFLGLIIGLIATFAMGFVIDLLVNAYEIRAPDLVATIKVLVGISLCYLGMTMVIQTQDDFRLVIPYVEFAKQLRGPKPLLIDSSILIDARVADLASTGVFQAPLVVPAFVIAELQALADSTDKPKRVRGRRGLDTVARLQRLGTLDLSIDETAVPGKSADQMLVELARLMPATIFTADTGLLRVALIRAVATLNIHDLANALKPALIPGTTLSIHMLRPGEQPGQAVGYLDDGTMVVTDRAAPHIGQDLLVEITSSLQTSAGRLLFARPAGEATPAPEPTTPPESPISPPPPAAATLPTEPQREPQPEPEAEPPPAAAPTLQAPRSTTTPAPVTGAPGPLPRRTSWRNPRR